MPNLRYTGLKLSFLAACVLCSSCAPKGDPGLPAKVLYDFSDRLDYALTDWSWSVLKPGSPESEKFLTGDWGEVRLNNGVPAGRWVSGRRAGLHVWMPVVPENTELTISLDTYVRSYLSQKLTVKINGRKAAEQTFGGKGATVQKINVPPDYWLGGNNEISFEFRYAGTRRARAALISEVRLEGHPETKSAERPSKTDAEGEWVQVPDTRTAWTVKVPRDGVLRVFPEWPADEGSTVRVAIRADGRRRVLKTYAQPLEAADAISLDDYTGKRVRVEFESLGPAQVKWKTCQIEGVVLPVDVNLYLVTIDSLRADRAGAYGYAKETTPALDRLARKGVMFLQALVVSNESIPSHASILTARYPQSHGILKNGMELQAQQRPLAYYLGRAGFDTACFVNWSLLAWGSMTGRDFNERAPVTGLESDGPVPGTNNVFARAAQWVESRADKRHFLWLHSQYLHFEQPLPPMYRFMFHPEGKGVDFTVNQLRDFFHAFSREEITWTDEQRDSILALDDGSIRMSDDHLAWFLERLAALGLDPYAAIVVTSDHGQNLGEFHRFSHVGRPFHHLLRVPLIMVLPGLTEPNSRVERPAEAIDIAPTLMDYLGLKVPARFQGYNWVPHLENPAAHPPADRALFAVAAHGADGWWYAVQKDDWFFFSDMAQEDYLFPMDGFTVGDRTENPKVAEDMKGLLREWLKTTPSVAAGGSTLDMPDDVKEILQKAGYLERDE